MPYKSPHLRISLPAKWWREVHIPPLGLADVVSCGIDLGCHVQHENTIFCDHWERRRAETVNVHLPGKILCLSRGPERSGRRWGVERLQSCRILLSSSAPSTETAATGHVLAPNYSIINTSCLDQRACLFII